MHDVRQSYHCIGINKCQGLYAKAKHAVYGADFISFPQLLLQLGSICRGPSVECIPVTLDVHRLLPSKVMAATSPALTKTDPGSPVAMDPWCLAWLSCWPLLRPSLSTSTEPLQRYRSRAFGILTRSIICRVFECNAEGGTFRGIISQAEVRTVLGQCLPSTRRNRTRSH